VEDELGPMIISAIRRTEGTVPLTDEIVDVSANALMVLVAEIDVKAAPGLMIEPDGGAPEDEEIIEDAFGRVTYKAIAIEFDEELGVAPDL
ncbi:MAG: hypothetical protein V4479_15135, partial [Actinomycetota bacterium]